MQPEKKLSPVIIALIVIVLVGVGTAAVVVSNQSKSSSTNESTKTEDTQTDSPATPADTSATYKDGTYSEMGHYISPGGAESIDVTVTLENDIITSATVTGNASGEAQEHQDDFIAGYKSSVVGKDIDTVSLSRVGGASLTTNGFNAALKLIKADAQS